MAAKKPHIDASDARRTGLFANAECRDCDYFLSGCGCDAEKELIALALADLYESNPDAVYSGMRFRPSSDDAANRCPMFWPGFEYLEELAAQDRDALMTWRENMNRLEKMGRVAA